MPNLSITKPINDKPADYLSKVWYKLIKEFNKLQINDEWPLIIGGERIINCAENEIKSLNPCNLETIATTYEAGEKEINEAINAALKAKKSWSNLKPETRILLFRDLAEVVDKRRHELSAAMMLECGFTAPEAAGGFSEMLDFLRFNPYYYNNLINTKLGDGNKETNWVEYRPLKGFATAVTPFNFPLAIGFNLPTVMALTGNTVVWKPSSDAILVSSLLMECLEEANFPPGVINMVFGRGNKIGKFLLEHKELGCVNFTGGYETAANIFKQVYSVDGRPYFPKVIAETGGKDFMWVHKSAKPCASDVAAQMISGAYGRTGQKCSANSRAYIDSEAFDDILESLVEQLRSFSLDVGDVTAYGTKMGPVINESAFNKIKEYIEFAKESDECEIIFGGKCLMRKGYFIDPTVVITNNPRNKLMVEEIFGPVLTLYRFDSKDEKETLEILKENPYKLTGSLYCLDPNEEERLTDILKHEAGNFYLRRKTTGALVDQQPFGGDGRSGTNSGAGGPDYLLNFISPVVIGRRHNYML